MSQSSSSSALSSPIRVCSVSSPGTTPEPYERLCRQKSMGAEEVPSSDSTPTDLEEAGIQRSTGNGEVALPTPDYSFANSLASSIVKRVKRLQVNDEVAENPHHLIRPPRFKPYEARRKTARDVASHEILISAYPSLLGIPEELVLHIVFYLDVFDIMSLRKVCS